MRLQDVLHEVPIRIIAFPNVRGPAEVIDGYRIDALFGETQCQFFVEAKESPNIGQDNDPGTVGVLGSRCERRKLRSIG